MTGTDPNVPFKVDGTNVGIWSTKRPLNKKRLWPGAGARPCARSSPSGHVPELCLLRLDSLGKLVANNTITK